jgi:hypothetical protein
MKSPMTSPMAPRIGKYEACAAVLALLGACTGSPQVTIPDASCGGVGQGCGTDAPCCTGFTCDSATQTCLLEDGDGGACQAVFGDCTANPNWCCGDSYCDPLITTCEAIPLNDEEEPACSIQGGDCTVAVCCTDLACDEDAGVCENSYQALGGPCTSAVQCAGTPAGAGTVPAVCDPAAGDCCIDTTNDCTANPTSCCTGAYCDPVPNTCAVAADPDGGACSTPAGACAQDTDCCPDLACDTDAGACIVPVVCVVTGTACTATTTCCGYCDPVSSLCADATNCFTPGTACALNTDCCADLVCDSDAGTCTGCATSTQGCTVPDAGSDAGTPDGGKADGGDAG